MFRFHTPLVEPCMRFARTRLPEETSRFRPRKTARSLWKANEAILGVQAGFRKYLGRRPCRFVFGTQPLTQPLTGMSVNCPIGFADRPKTEVVGPTIHHLIEFRYYC